MTGAGPTCLALLAAALLAWPAPAGRARLPRPAVARWSVAGLSRLAGRRAAVVPVGALAGAATAVVSTPVVALLAAGSAGLAVRAAQGRWRAQVERCRTAALAEALGAVAAEIRAGRTLEEAVAQAVAGCPDPGVAPLLAPVVHGGSPPSAGDPLSPVLGRVAAAVRVSRETGCSLAGVLTAMEDDLRDRRRAELELQSATSGPRASATVLAGLPVLGLLMGSGVGADPWHLLTSTATGTVLLVVGVGLEVAGLWWSARLVHRAAAG